MRIFLEFYSQARILEFAVHSDPAQRSQHNEIRNLHRVTFWTLTWGNRDSRTCTVRKCLEIRIFGTMKYLIMFLTSLKYIVIS